MTTLKFRARDAKTGELLMQLYNGQCFAWASMEMQIDIIIEQFTGLTDINGIDIYEGDVVYLGGYGNYECEFPFIELYEAAAENDIGARIGNIYENKELKGES